MGMTPSRKGPWKQASSPCTKSLSLSTSSEDPPGLGHRHPARLRERALPPVKEPCPQGFLQLADLDGEGGLGEVDPFRGPGEASFLGQGHEVAQLV